MVFGLYDRNGRAVANTETFGGTYTSAPAAEVNHGEIDFRPGPADVSYGGKATEQFFRVLTWSLGGLWAADRAGPATPLSLVDAIRRIDDPERTCANCGLATLDFAALRDELVSQGVLSGREMWRTPQKGEVDAALRAGFGPGENPLSEADYAAFLAKVRADRRREGRVATRRALRRSGNISE